MLSVALLGAVAVWASTFAYQGNPGVQNPDCQDPARYEAIQKSLSTANYTEWKTLMTNKGVTRRITSETSFKTYVAYQEALKKWDKVTSDKLAVEPGLGQRKMDWSGSKNAMGKGMRRSNTK